MRQQVAHFAQHALVTFESREAGKVLRHDQHRKVPGATGCTGVPDVVGPVVVDLEDRRRERLEADAQGFGGRVQDGSSARWRDSQRPWTRANTRNRPIPPQTLKLTQVSVG